MHQSITAIRLKTASKALDDLEEKRLEAELRLIEAEMSGDVERVNFYSERLEQISRYLRMATDLIEVFSRQLEDH
jgi:hypothetical protein